MSKNEHESAIIQFLAKFRGKRNLRTVGGGGGNPKSTRGSSFATKVKDDVPPRSTMKCPSCGGGHWLSQCDDFKKKSVEERFKLVRLLKLCDNCLVAGHVARSCGKKSFCKGATITIRHSYIEKLPTQMMPKS